MFGQLAVGGDLAAEYRQQRRAIGIQFQRVVAGDAAGVGRIVVQQRAHAGVGGHHVGRADLLREVAVAHLAQVGHFVAIDGYLRGVAVVFHVGGANQREVLLVGDGKNDALVRVLENVGVGVREQALHDDVAAFYQADGFAGRGLDDAAQQLLHPRAGGVYYRTGADGGLLAVGALQGGVPAVALALGRHTGGTGEDGGAALGGVDGVQYHQAGVVDPAVGIHKALVVAGFQRAACRVAVKADALAACQAAAARQVVVQEQATAYQPRRALGGVVRHDKAQRPHDVRGGVQQHFAFLQRFAHQAELVIFQIAQAAVNQLGAGRRGMRGQVVLFTQQHAQAAPCRIAGNACAVDTATDYQQIVLFHCLSFVLRWPQGGRLCC